MTTQSRDLTSATICASCSPCEREIAVSIPVQMDDGAPLSSGPLFPPRPDAKLSLTRGPVVASWQLEIGCSRRYQASGLAAHVVTGLRVWLLTSLPASGLAAHVVSRAGDRLLTTLPITETDWCQARSGQEGLGLEVPRVLPLVVSQTASKI